ncbi:hypothetical protein DIPPA_35519 [Diplonema papillatum]|nr:hypothetical protein DIPPA_35519 [Diplonema papillatum]
MNLIIIFFIAMEHLGEGALLLLAPEIHAIRLGHDGLILSYLLGIFNIELGVACLLAACRRTSDWAVRASLLFHIASFAVYAFDVFIAEDSGYAISSFGFMMLVHLVTGMWVFVSFL